MRSIKTLIFCFCIFYFSFRAQTVALVTYGNASCPGPCDGVATFSVLGATGPYSVSVTNTTCAISNTLSFSTDSITIINLCKCAGAYTFSFYDGANSLIGSQTLNIFSNPPINIFANNSPISCIGSCNSTATASVFNGTAPYNYTWSPMGITTPIASSLCAGMYSVVVTDANGCVGATQLIIFNPPNPCVGIEEFSLGDNDISIYPNPAGSFLNIKAEHNQFENSELLITNYLGQYILKLPYRNSIDISSLQNGYYTIEIITPHKQSFHRKFLKE